MLYPLSYGGVTQTSSVWASAQGVSHQANPRRSTALSVPAFAL